MRGKAWASLGLLAASACSNVASPVTKRSCEVDQDCFAHERCSQAHGGQCVSRQLPRRSSFGLAGLARAQGSLRAVDVPWELRGCEMDAFDPATGVSRINLESRLVPIRLGNLAYGHPYEGICAASCAPGAFCDTQSAQCTFARHGRWTLERSSRLGLSPLDLQLSRTKGDPHPRHRAPHLPLYWPCGDQPTLLRESEQELGALSARHHRPPHTRTLILPSTPCVAKASGPADPLHFNLIQRAQDTQRYTFVPKPLGLRDNASPAPVTLDLVWEDAAFTVLASGPRGQTPRATASCTTDEDCPGATSCSKAGLCYLSIPQSRAARIEHLSDSARDVVLHRQAGELPSGRLTATLHSEDPRVASMRLHLEDTSEPPRRSQQGPISLCIPHWRRIGDAPIELKSGGAPIAWSTHSPVPLLPGRMACDARDLSRDHATNPGACHSDLRPSVTLVTSLTPKGNKIFKEQGCSTPVHHPGSLSLKLPLECSDAGSCAVWPRAFDEAGPCYDYQIELTRPPHSLFRSFRHTLRRAHCPPGPPATLELDHPWQPRPVLRGQVHAPASVTTMRVEVMAERLDDGEQDALGPFFFHQTVILSGPRQGQFALPVEPGKYIITALPHDPLSLGPAPFRIVDTRSSATSVDDPRTQLELLAGPLVQVQIYAPKDMDTVRARPLDLGSWVDDPNLPDLNATSTCFPHDRACAIRMLTAPGTRSGREIPVDFRSVLRWISRPGGELECP